jgi:cell division protein FtsQ
MCKDLWQELNVEKDRRSELLRRQRILQGETNVKHITRRAASQLNDETLPKQKFPFSLFKKREKGKSNFDRPYPLSANESMPKSEGKAPKKINISWRVLSGLLVVVFSACIFVAWRSPDYQVSVVEIKGIERISQDEVVNSFEVMRKPIISIKPEEIIQKISNSFPEFKDIKVTVSLPNTITVNLTERKPIIAWKINDTSIWIDSDGIVFPTRGQTGELLTIESSSLPAFSNPSGLIETEILMDKYQLKRNYWKLPPFSMVWYEYHRAIEPGFLNAVVRLNSQIPSEKVLIFDPHRGLGWNDPRGWKIFVGFNLEQINEKWLEYEKIVSEIIKQGIQPTLVSVEYLHAPYYRVD